MAENEVYINAPLALVVVEVRHAHCPAGNAALDAIGAALRGRVPLPRVESGFAMEIGDQGSSGRQVGSMRFLSRDSYTSVSVRDEALVIETTDYRGWEDFCSLVLLAVDARSDVAPPPGIDRLGIRFINEIRVPFDVQHGWRPWISDALLGPQDLADQLDRTLRAFQGAVVFDSAHGENTQVVNFADANGQAVQNQPNLRRKRQEDGRFFLLDIDSSWTSGSESNIPDFDRQMIGSTLAELHEPIDSIFESLITERLREEVLRVRSDNN